MTTPRYTITKAYRKLTIIDMQETPTDTQIMLALDDLNDLLQATFAGTVADFLKSWVDYPVPASARSIILPKTIFKVWNCYYREPATGLRSREIPLGALRDMNKVDVTSTITKYHVLRNPDDTLTLYVWPYPQMTTTLNLEIGSRVQTITADNLDVDMALPTHFSLALEFLLAKVMRPSFGVPIAEIQDVMAMADRYEMEFKTSINDIGSVKLSRVRG